MDLAITNDEIDEGDETIIATVADGGNTYKVGNDTADVMVLDNDCTAVVESATPAGGGGTWDGSTWTVTRPAPGAGWATISITLKVTQGQGQNRVPATGQVVRLDNWAQGPAQAPGVNGDYGVVDSTGHVTFTLRVGGTVSLGNHTLHVHTQSNLDTILDIGVNVLP